MSVAFLEAPLSYLIWFGIPIIIGLGWLQTILKPQPLSQFPIVHDDRSEKAPKKHSLRLHVTEAFRLLQDGLAKVSYKP